MTVPTPESEPGSASGPEDRFATTRWSLVLAVSGDGPETGGAALEALCQAYWHPLYFYIRRRTSSVHDAQDLTQAFFENLLERETIARADPDRGRFRAFLLTACKRFLANEWKKGQATRRGGGRQTLSLDFDSAEDRYNLVATDPLTPERIYEQQWVHVLLANVLEKLRAEYESRDRTDQFDILKPFLSGAGAPGSHQRAAETLGMSESAARVAAHRLRTRYRELIRAEIAHTVDSTEDVEDEIRRLFAVLAEKK